MNKMNTMTKNVITAQELRDISVLTIGEVALISTSGARAFYSALRKKYGLSQDVEDKLLLLTIGDVSNVAVRFHPHEGQVLVNYAASPDEESTLQEALAMVRSERSEIAYEQEIEDMRRSD